MKITIPLFAAALAALPTPAWAVELLYALTPMDADGYRATWRMALNPTPTQAVKNDGFALERVSGTFPQTAGDAYLDFFFAANDGGLSISDADGKRILATLYGEQLYTGSEAAPTMVRGTFTLTTEQSGGQRYTLSVTDTPPPVPEPATWTMMIGGFALIGAALRRSHRVTVRYA